MNEKFRRWLDGETDVMEHILDSFDEPYSSREEVKRRIRGINRRLGRSEGIRRLARVERKGFYAAYRIVSVVSCVLLIGVLLFTIAHLPRYGVENPIAAIENLTATTLRNIIGSMDLDTTLTSRETINTEMRSQLDIATDPWGIKVNRVELKNILPPDAIREAMEKQMKAEREKREVVTLAQGKKESAVLTAQGNKEAAILNAEAEKQTAILHAEAEKERRIREAEGQAQAIRAVKEAEAEGIRMLKEAGADESVIRLRSLDTLAKVAEGESTKILIPSDIQNMAGLLTSLKESVK